jgi:uncharacterized repeat protein (TIGR03809 family)
MAQRVDAARGQERAQEILDRWCALAEERLDHLTELFETGRWRRYHSEVSFLENIQEAKSAVETWRRLASREALLDNSAVDISWLNSPKPVPPRRNPLAGYHVPPRRVGIIAEQAPLAPRMSPEIAERVLEQAILEQTLSEHVIPEHAIPKQAASEQLVSRDIAPPIDDSWQQALDLSAMQERYPLLRNALT